MCWVSLLSDGPFHTVIALFASRLARSRIAFSSHWSSGWWICEHPPMDTFATTGSVSQPARLGQNRVLQGMAWRSPPLLIRYGAAPAAAMLGIIVSDVAQGRC